jgi:hypothetical protein
MDEAVAQFSAMLRERLGEPRTDRVGLAPAPPEEKEARQFHLAELLIALACPDARACIHQRCRRDSMCRHLARVRAKQASGRSSHPRRTPGAEAARYAIWVYMSSAPPGT